MGIFGGTECPYLVVLRILNVMVDCVSDVHIRSPRIVHSFSTSCPLANLLELTPPMMPLVSQSMGLEYGQIVALRAHCAKCAPLISHTV